ncbi:hypothetical protein V1477_011289 [Vespula maculifrons]|uniref:Ubiquitin-like domain-containing protein n=1 Tax=Vespula maculifrons TaxID=7453 RepID=A0ABD2C4W9_VESMC
MVLESDGVKTLYDFKGKEYNLEKIVSFVEDRMKTPMYTLPTLFPEYRREKSELDALGLRKGDTSVHLIGKVGGTRSALASALHILLALIKAMELYSSGRKKGRESIAGWLLVALPLLAVHNPLIQNDDDDDDDDGGGDVDVDVGDDNDVVDEKTRETLVTRNGPLFRDRLLTGVGFSRECPYHRRPAGLPHGII